jgi:polyisoprenoid-binding protein YceI
MAETATSTLSKTQIPEPGTWAIDTSHSQIAAVARHFMVSKVRGHFRTFSGVLHIEEDPGQSWAEVTIDAASIDTADETRDGHLKSADFLDAENHPEIKFRSTNVSVSGDGSFELTGDLTMRGVTKPVTLAGQFQGVIQDPYGMRRAFFSAEGQLARGDWGVSWNQALETGGVAVSKKLTLEVEVEATKQ